MTELTVDGLIPVSAFLPLVVHEIENAYPMRSEWEVWTQDPGAGGEAFQVCVCASRELAEAIARLGVVILGGTAVNESASLPEGK